MIDATTLAAIVAEARDCFINEDAPEYLTMLLEGIERLQSALKNPSTQENLEALYKDLGRAAHTIKGGAGMAELQTLTKVAHKLEDLFEGLEQGKIQDRDTALQLIILATDEIQNQLDIVSSGQENSADDSALEIIAALGEFLDNLETANESVDLSIGNQQNDFIKTTLNVDLEACLQRVEESIAKQESLPKIEEKFKILQQQCTLLGEAFNFPLLVEVATVTQEIQKLKVISLEELTKKAIAEIRQLRQAFIDGNPLVTLSDNLTGLLPKKETTPPAKNLNLKDYKEAFNLGKNEQELYLRVPLSRLEQMSNTVGELLINYESLLLYESQFRQASFSFKKRVQQLNPLREKVEHLYDKLSIDREYQTNVKEFDSLEFDRYTEVHTTLQQFQELMVQVQEIREDIDLVRQEFHETLVQLRRSIENLDENLTQSRLVTFGTLAHTFIQPVEKLSQRYNKSVKLVIEGENVWVDQAVLEQLRTPLTHLIRNAFDHGIESPQKRIDKGKERTGIIKLSAQNKSNQVIISIADDGGGVNVNKVHEKAVKLGLCPSDKTIEELGIDKILGFIFSPGFSTAEKVSDLSGRGLGLDIVKLQLDKLRGNISIHTEIGKGTTFDIGIPLSLNIVSLLLFRCQKQILAIPSINIVSIIIVSNFIDKNEPNINKIYWQNDYIDFFPLVKILPYHQSDLFSAQENIAKIGLILKVNQKNIAIGVDEIIGERQLVVKPFDEAINVPPYLAGCTILGTGEVVPIFVPDYFESLLTSLKGESSQEQPKQQNTNTILVVDDSIAVRRTLNRILTQCNYQVVQCRDGKEAWDLLAQGNQNFSLAISDLEMPRMDGFTLLQTIRNHPSCQQLPVVILTSRENVLHREKAMSLGANAYFSKPFNTVSFLDAIANLLK